MKNYVIQSGAFTTNGNLTGYTALGERIHFHKRQMEAMGIKEAKDLKFPFYAIATNKTINPFDENGKPATNADGSLKTAERLTALSAFATKEALIGAHVDSATLDVEIKKNIISVAKEAGLTDAAVDALASLSI